MTGVEGADRAGGAGPADPAGAGEPADLAAELRVAVNRLVYALRRKAGGHGLTPSRYTALSVLRRRGAIRSGELAEAMGIARPTLTRLLDALSDEGLVTRTPDPGDARVLVVELAEPGHAVMAAVRAEADADLRADIDSLEPAQRAALAAAVPALQRLADLRLAGGRAAEGPASS